MNPRNRSLLRRGVVGLVCAAGLLALHAAYSRPSIRMDGYGYYAPLASAVFDHDLRLDNEIAHAGNFLRNAWFTLPDGRLVDPYPVGAAVLWSPVLVVARALDPDRVRHGKPWQNASPGFAPRYVTAIAIATGLQALLAAWILIAALVRRTAPGAGALAAVACMLGTPLVYYALAEPSYAHTSSFLASASLLAVVLHGGRGTRTWLALGALWGLVSLVRYQDAVLGILVAPRLIAAVHPTSRGTYTETVRHLVAFLGAAAVVFLPQILFWQRIYGQPLVFAVPHGFMHWSHPQLLPFLFSTWQGAFVWSPVLLLGIAGIGCVPERGLRAVLWVAIALEIYASAAAGDWWGSASFGARRLVVIAPLAGLGLAHGLVAVRGGARSVWRHALVLGVLALLVGWNLRLAQYSIAGWLPLNNGNVGEYARDYPPGHPHRAPWPRWDYARLASELADAERRMWRGRSAHLGTPQ